MGHGERRAVWQQILGPVATQLNGALDNVSTQFSLSLMAMHEAADHVLSNPPQSIRSRRDPKSPVAGLPAASARRSGWIGAAHYAAAEFNDLVLPEAAAPDTARDHYYIVRQSHPMVHERWGFAQKESRGLGISALFAGASGTGKTMAAEVLATSCGSTSTASI